MASASEPQPPAPEIPVEARMTDRRALVSEVIRNFPANKQFRTHSILKAYPSLAQYRSCVVDLVYEEYCRRRDAGQEIRVSELAASYPDVAQSLYRVVEIEQVLQAHPSLLPVVPDDQWPQPGTDFCGVLLLEQLGRGALSRVYVGRQAEVGGRKVVVKICVRGSEEAALLGELKHSGIALIHQLTHDPITGFWAIIMPYETRATLHDTTELLRRIPDGIPRDERCLREIVDRINGEDRSLPSSTQRQDPACNRQLEHLVCDWGLALCEALQHAHDARIRHYDVKPGNVILRPDLSVQLLDFNLAMKSGFTESLFGGTLPFMAPEQLRHVIAGPGSGVSGGADEIPDGIPCDVYGLSATLWFLILGEPPFGNPVEETDRTMNAHALLVQQSRGLNPDRCQQVAAATSPHLMRTLSRGLSANPSERFASAAEFAAAIRAGHPRHLAEQATHARQRRRSVLLTGLITAMLIVIVVACSRWVLQATPDRTAVAHAQSLMDRGRLPEAEQEIRALQEQHPDNPECALLLAECLRMQHRYRDVQAVISRFMVSDPSEDFRFMDLYCRTAMLPSPSGNRANQSASLVPWRRILQEWHAMQGSEKLGTAATMNEVAMLYRMSLYAEAEALLNSVEPARIPDRFLLLKNLIVWTRNDRAQGADEQADAARQLEDVDPEQLMGMVSVQLALARYRVGTSLPGSDVEQLQIEFSETLERTVSRTVSHRDVLLLMHRLIPDSRQRPALKIPPESSTGSEATIANDIDRLLVSVRDMPDFDSGVSR